MSKYVRVCVAACAVDCEHRWVNGCVFKRVRAGARICVYCSSFQPLKATRTILITGYMD